MAPKKRGVTDSLCKADSEEIMESWALELGSSDDEVPDEVTFEDSKAQALRSVKQALENGRREKDLLKEKRKKRLELFQEQKKSKLLSAKLLEEIDSSQHSQQEADTRHQDEDEDQEKKTQKQKLKHSRILKGNYEVTTVKPPTSASSQQKAAEDFLHSQLYGAGSYRTTTNEMLSLQNKTSRTKGAAFCFVKSNWAPEQKSKAENLKRRWIHKQVSSS